MPASLIPDNAEPSRTPVNNLAPTSRVRTYGFHKVAGSCTIPSPQ
jgi:hypothetical protein